MIQAPDQYEACLQIKQIVLQILHTRECFGIWITINTENLAIQWIEKLVFENDLSNSDNWALKL